MSVKKGYFRKSFRMNLGVLCLLGMNFFAIQNVNGALLSLNDLTEKILEKSFSLQALESEVKVQGAMAIAVTAPEAPMLGSMFMNTDMGSERYTLIRQKFKFPMKYWHDHRSYQAMREASRSELQDQKQKLQAEIRSLYYGIYVNQRLQNLTEANINTIREFARVAERRYASGQGLQQDSMKAHVELTQMEVLLLSLQTRERDLQSRLSSLGLSPVGLSSVGFSSAGERRSRIVFVSQDIPRPQTRGRSWQELKDSLTEVVQESPGVQIQTRRLRAKEQSLSSVAWSFAPDVELMYQEGYPGMETKEAMYGVSLSLPLWFWGPSQELSAARSERNRQQALLQQSVLDLRAEITSLIRAVENGEKILKIFETSLIPQAETAFNLSGASYRSSRGSFLDFLDSRKAFYQVRKDYFESLASFANQLAQLESLTGRELAHWSGDQQTVSFKEENF